MVKPGFALSFDISGESSPLNWIGMFYGLLERRVEVCGGAG